MDMSLVSNWMVANKNSANTIGVSNLLCQQEQTTLRVI